MKKILSAILVVVLLLGTFAVEAGAALEPIQMVDDAGNKLDAIDYAETVKQYLTHEFKTDEEKLDKMTRLYTKNGYELYADEFTGEVATKNVATGEILFTNPRDIASSNATHSSNADAIKYQLMSQIIVKYIDNGAKKEFNSFEQAAMNGQIDVKTIKNGLRVEYTIGREDTKYLVPRLIEKTRFEENILRPMAEGVAPKYGVTPEEVMNEKLAKYFEYFTFSSFYVLKDPNAPGITDQDLQVMQNQFEITKKAYNGGLMAVYVCDPDITPTQLRQVEDRIKTYCPLYTYEQLDYDHELTEYVKDDRAPALFKMALEYRLDEFGLTVRLPANGIRFNEAEYQLDSITILPWMGAGSTDNTGYTFFPDGSGAIFRFEDNLENKDLKIEGSIYGQDYAYHTITGTHQEIIRYPVFGIVEDKEDKSSGFVAILEEGDALAKIELMHYNAYCKYNSVRVSVNPRPSDKYVLADAVSVGGNDEVTIISKRKYVGDYKIRYIMLTDDAVAAEKGIANYYQATWLGMASAYRDYLASPYSTGTQNNPKDEQVSVLNALTANDIKENIPLYIETFGSMQTIEKVLSIPVNTKVALTSFDNIQEMYQTFSEKGIDNVNFKLTGYYNGGMYSSVPYKLKIEKSVGGEQGLKDLIADAKEKGYGVYLDFDFVYSTSKATKMFDGLSNNRDLVRAIDDRYTSKQYYSATRQSYTSYFELAISPSRFSYFYDKVSAEYLSYDPVGISLSTLGSELNSDFDEDDPYNRDDAKKFTVDLFKKIDNDYKSVMVDSANAYAWQYIDHMINVAVDSSRYIKASNSVPFLGVVLHGYVQFAGTPMNMEGNIGYAMLKAIENGSGLYFVLSYDNTELLKNDEQLSQYYSVRYDIWFDELAERYQAVNSVLKDLQLMQIIDHEFLIGERIPDEDELLADAEALEEANKLAKEEAEKLAKETFNNNIRYGRNNALGVAQGYLAEAKLIESKFYDGELAWIKQISASLTALEDREAEYAAVIAEYQAAVIEEKKAWDAYEPFKTEIDRLEELKKEIKENDKDNKAAISEIQQQIDDLTLASGAESAAWTSADNRLDAAKEAMKSIQEDADYKNLSAFNSEAVKGINNLKKYLANWQTEYEKLMFAWRYLNLKKDDRGNALEVSQTVIDDINTKKAQMEEIKVELEAIYNEILNDYDNQIEDDEIESLYEKIIVFLPDQDYKANDGASDNSGATGDSENNDDAAKEDEYNYTKYTNDDGNIVAVTYGEGNNAYRTFILNYNFFDITTVYNGTTYTVPAFGYIIIQH